MGIDGTMYSEFQKHLLCKVTFLNCSVSCPNLVAPFCWSQTFGELSEIKKSGNFPKGPQWSSFHETSWNFLSWNFHETFGKLSDNSKIQFPPNPHLSTMPKQWRQYRSIWSSKWCSIFQPDSQWSKHRSSDDGQIIRICFLEDSVVAPTSPLLAVPNHAIRIVHLILKDYIEASALGRQHGGGVFLMLSQKKNHRP